MNNFAIKAKKGFTLVELLIVIVVVGVLAGAAIIFLDPITRFQKANDIRRKSDLSQIQKALEIFRQDFGKYPDAVDKKIKSTNPDSGAADWGGSGWQPYMNTLPKDPDSSKNYVYVLGSGGQTYYLYATLDRGVNDPQTCFSNGDPCSSAVVNNVASACGGNCNYGVSSQNVSP